MPESTARCPEWCSAPSGHPFALPVVDLDSPSRMHRRTLSCSPNGRLSITVEALETRRRGWHSHTTPPGIVLIEHLGPDELPAGTELTASEARWLASQLIEAAAIIEGAHS